MVYNAVLDVVFTNVNATEPLTQLEVQNWLRLSSETDVALALLTAKSARVICETYANISFTTRKVTATICNLQGDILLPYTPYVSELKVYDELGVEIIDVEYRYIAGGLVNLITPKNEWLKVEYNAGYATTPQIFKDAIKQQLAYMWENRGDESVGIFNLAKATLKPFRKVM